MKATATKAEKQRLSRTCMYMDIYFHAYIYMRVRNKAFFVFAGVQKRCIYYIWGLCVQHVINSNPGTLVASSNNVLFPKGPGVIFEAIIQTCFCISMCIVMNTHMYIYMLLFFFSLCLWLCFFKYMHTYTYFSTHIFIFIYVYITRLSLFSLECKTMHILYLGYLCKTS